MSAERGYGVNGLARLTRLLKWFAAFVVSVGVVLTAGLALVALVTQAGSSDTWSRWSNAGQAFGALTAVFSGFALAALVITFWMQLQELKAQRTELCQQRELLGQARAALHRSAEAEIGGLHGELMKMAINDDDLAAVWPTLKADLTSRRNRQYLYANVILQHHRLRFRTSDYTEAELRGVLGYLFTSPLMREFWQDSERSRTTFLVPGTAEFIFQEIATQVLHEHRGLVACPGEGSTGLATIAAPTPDDGAGPEGLGSRSEAA
jgi:hypothetical protein